MKWKVLASALVLAGCGVIYNAPHVSEGVDDSGVKVRVVPVTPETVAMANRTPYTPKALPAAFFASAGGAGGMKGAGALPEPALLPEARPGRLELRVPDPVPDAPYRIGVEDELRLAVPKMGSTAEELTGLLAKATSREGYRVQDDGTISIPDVGRVRVAGKTLEEAEDAIFNKLVEAGLNPVFSLEVSDFRSQRVSVGGAVKKPTVVPITLSPLRLNEALSAAGGVALQDLDYASIRIFRDGKLYQIPVKELYRRPDLQNLRLKNGDSIFVDTDFELDKAKAYFEQQIRLSEFRQKSRQLALDELNAEIDLRRGELEERRSNFEAQLKLDAVDRDYVYITGEVARQSRYPLPFEHRATLADALYSEGEGVMSRTGDPRQIYLLRGSNDPAEFGAITAWQLDASNVANLVLATRMELRPSDIIFVAEQPVTSWNRVLTQLTPSIVTSSVAASVN
ncbi:polysaccharide biosynthesis/export family protein [Jhaorihella thermophila]|uniref:Polysaccharide export outer membrane protein n=1 Tax=Jhaorihella thermophila TaxID=488547 RepID=A0A1H5YKM7_9RHOB|nr:polysaccharide biosynthesis/export family protein [Jhaorihella thermophila]SEG24628.1 polysaccharide export outer membrane protein [Jhaorihella thermophila]